MQQVDTFIQGLDAAMDAHLDWTRRVLRCAVLRTSPGDDVMQPQAHTLCQFGRWFERERAVFDGFDRDTALRIEHAHRTMHDAIRALCASVLAGHPGRDADLQAFESTQSEALYLFARFKTLILTTAARLDPLTGLPMRHGLEREFALCQKEAQRKGEDLYAVVIDIDHFKKINDTYGHPAGDAVLQEFAATLKSTVRENEPLFRYGGEEFLILLRGSGPQFAAHAVQRILDTIRSSPVKTDAGRRLHLTATIGVALVSNREDLASAVKRADEALYMGKNGGRDRLIIASDRR